MSSKIQDQLKQVFEIAGISKQDGEKLVEELIDTCGIEIFDLADKDHKADLSAYFEDAAYEKYQDEIDLAANDEWIAVKSRYW